MARHRNVRGYNYDEDFEDDDLYGQSVDDDYCISPATAAQFIYSKRDRQTSFTEPLEEEEFEDDEPDNSAKTDVALSSVDQARLYSCLDHMREVLGETVVEQVMIDAILQCQFDVAKALELVFTHDCNKNLKPKTQNIESTGRTAKEDIFPSLQNLAYKQNVSCSTDNLGKCRESVQSVPVAPQNEFSLATLDLSSLLDCEKEKCDDHLKSEKSFSDITSSLFLSALTDNSKPAALSGISLQDLISVSRVGTGIGEESDILGASLSEISSSHPQRKFQGPDINWLQAEDQSSGSLNIQQSTEVGVQCAESTSNVSQDGSISHFTKNEMLDNQTYYKNTDLFGSLSSFLQNSDTSTSTDSDSLFAPKYGSPSLADLIQEHNYINPLHDFPLSSPQKNPPNVKEPQPESLLNMSPLTNPLHTTFEIPSLTTALSSLAVYDRSSAKEPPVSLSDLIAGADEPFSTDTIWSYNTPALIETDKNIDLSILINNPEATENISALNPKVLPSQQSKSGYLPKIGTNNKKMHISSNCKKSIYRAKTLKAKPSAFALSLCFSCIPKACKKILIIQQCHHTSTSEEPRDMVKPAIIPFHFQTPSPDDIVKENQKKAFMR
ncbi:HBS1-like protein isoform 2-T2 [Discoglossus pictus]